MNRHMLHTVGLTLALVGLGCSDESAGTGSGGAGGTTSIPSGDSYTLDSKFVDGQSAISHTGQTFRHALVESMKAYVGGLTDAVDGNGNPPQTRDELVAAMQYYYGFDGDSSGLDPHGIGTAPPPAETTWNDIASGKSLDGKMAGNDDVTDHQDWGGGAFEGWGDAAIAQHGGSLDSPEGLLLAMFNTLGFYVEDRIQSGPQSEPGTIVPIAEVYVTPEGWDLQQLIQKFLLVGVTYSQGTDDYLDADVEGKGLLSPNSRDEDEPFTTLGHHWDEGFGYFGAARDYHAYSDEELAESGGRDDWQGMHDTDGNGAIDLVTEVNWGASVNAAKRDLAAASGIDLSGDAYEAFWAGRKLIYGAGEALTEGEMAELTGYAQAATDAWEAAIAATIAHYINDTIADTEAIDGAPGDYVFVDHAKHWSELKGFALGLQFNPRSKLGASDFAMLHSHIGDAPVLATATATERMDYVASLLAARDILEQRCGFDAADVEGW
jgi:Domain of unknown function (DUF4856)